MIKDRPQVMPPQVMPQVMRLGIKTAPQGLAEELEPPG